MTVLPLPVGGKHGDCLWREVRAYMVVHPVVQESILCLVVPRSVVVHGFIPEAYLPVTEVQPERASPSLRV